MSMQIEATITVQAATDIVGSGDATILGGKIVRLSFGGSYDGSLVSVEVPLDLVQELKDEINIALNEIEDKA